jgi:protein-L-isoaspartate(D-aspartate) O-methyltransferase
MTTSAAQAHSSEALRAEMTDRIIAYRAEVPGMKPLSQLVLHAMRAVPRHAFVPDVSLQEAYGEAAVITKRSEDGAALSCASVPSVVAMMLDQLRVRQGDHVLEIGTGTGYNAALLAELAGPAGQVTTIDIDSEVTAQARQALAATGYEHVRVLTCDGNHGEPSGAPYDRLIATVSPWDIPPAWWQQLAPRGRMVLPLRWRGQARSVAFARRDDRLISDAVELCGFIPMTGDCDDQERTAPLGPADLATMTWDADQDVNDTALPGILGTARLERWSGEHVSPQEPFDGIWLRLTATEPGTCRLVLGEAAVKAGLRHPDMPARCPAVAQGDSLAYLTLRRASNGARRWELGAVGYGPRATNLATRICAQIRAWNSDRTTQPAITAYPAHASAPPGASGCLISKPHTRLHLNF